MSQPTEPAPAPQAPDAAVPSKKKMKKIKDDSGGGGRGIFSKITRKLAWVFSGIIFAGIFFWGLVEIALYGATPNVSFAGLVGKFSIDRFLLLGGIVALIPPAIVYLAESKRRDSIDNNIPHLIRDIADAGRSGMTLVRSIEISAERDYGPLTRALKKLIAKISFRVPLERARHSFAAATGPISPS